MKPISQRIAKISLIFNVILTLACMGLFVYALLQKTIADRNATEALVQRKMAVEQMDLAIQERQRADSAAMVALSQRALAIAICDSVKLKQTKTK